ncbi:hypothetical protein V8E52_000471 [Russula decolorans]
MPENIMLTEMTGELSQVEEGQHGLPNPYLREGDTRDDGQQQRSMSLGVALTGYRLLTTSIIVGVGIPKAVYSYRGQSLISPTLDWIGGIIFAFLLFWLGEIKDERPEFCPRFFKVDLAPHILEFLSRDDVYVWFPSVLTLLLAVESTLSFARDTKKQIAKNAGSEVSAQLSEDSLTLLVLATCTAICLVCLHCLRVFWPGRLRRVVDYGFNIVAYTMIFPHILFLIITIWTNSSVFTKTLSAITMRLLIWMLPWTFFSSEGERYNETIRQLVD